MNNYDDQKELLEYVNAATDLAESIKRNILHSKDDIPVIDEKTKLALSRFQIAANNIVDLENHLMTDASKLN